MAESLLRKALDFDDVDLDANRNGAITPKQRLMLSRKQGWQISHTPGTYFFLFSVLLIATCALWNPLSQTLLLVLVVYTALAVVISSVSLTLLMNRLIRIRIDLREGTVHTIGGQVSLDVRSPSRYNVKCSLRVQDMRFEISKAVMLAFHNGEYYRVYYTPHSKTVLSAELMETTA